MHFNDAVARAYVTANSFSSYELRDITALLTQRKNKEERWLPRNNLGVRDRQPSQKQN